MKIRLLFLSLFIPLISGQQQDINSYKENYGLYSNIYNFPNYGNNKKKKFVSQTNNNSI